MKICTVVNYDYLKKLQDEDYNKYLQAKMDLADRLLDLVEEHYIPDLRKHIVMKIVDSPTTDDRFIMAPKGNAYGSEVTTENLNFGRLKSKTPFHNLFWCSASSGYGGVHGTTCTGILLYEDFTGDKIPYYQDPDFDIFRKEILNYCQKARDNYGRNGNKTIEEISDDLISTLLKIKVAF